MNCKFCNSNLISVINFGKMPIANAFLEKSDFKNEYFFNLEATVCERCKLFQLSEQPEPKLLFHENYAFFAETSTVMQDHFKALSNELINKFNLQKNDLVVEIGNNDGGMVYYLSQNKYNSIGVDPSKNVADRAAEKGVKIINDFFDYRCSEKINSEYGKAKFFLSANTLAHIPDINSVFQGIRNLLDDEGIFITEDPYLLDVLKKISYDQIYDEHVFIFSLRSIQNICEKYNLEVFDIKKLETAGGSMRYYIAKKGKKTISNNVKEIQNYESKLFESNEVFDKFRDDCLNSKKSLNNLLNKLSKEKSIVGYGATSKSTTIFNFCEIGEHQIKFLTDTTSTKINKFTPGTHIPIYSYEYFNENMPDYCFLLAWNHSKEIFKKEKNNFSVKGEWITHIPEAKIINGNNF